MVKGRGNEIIEIGKAMGVMPDHQWVLEGKE